MVGTAPVAGPAPPRCDYFEAGRCRSCALIETPYEAQLQEKERRCRELLPSVPDGAWLPSVRGGVRGFRNKAKLVVGGEAGAVTLGILGPDGGGVDLRDCLIQSDPIRSAIPRLAAFLESTGLPPYSVPLRRGEMKFVHVTAAPSGRLMLRFVGRTQRTLDVLRSRLGELRAAIPEAAVISVNLLPEHKAMLEGEREEMLLGSSLTIELEPSRAADPGSHGLGSRAGGSRDSGAPGAAAVPLHLLPRSFFQTNSDVAAALYAQAAEWVDREDPASLWDLYCGVGGFALHCASKVSGIGESGRRGPGGPGRQVLGVEISEAAVRSAERSAREAGLAASFVAQDATAFALAASDAEVPEAVIVNPPRRGIGRDLAAWLERAPVRQLVYSSCNPESLARDLEAMPSYAVHEARVFDMFPHTTHVEVMVLLERR